jgi:hypothetical protein
MEASSKPTTFAPTPVTEPAPMTIDAAPAAAAAADATAAADVASSDAKTGAADGKKKGGAKKPKSIKSNSTKPKEPKGSGKSKAKGVRSKAVYSESDLLNGISKPATRRLFKQVPGSETMRLADNATDSIRALLGQSTKRLSYAIAESVKSQGRQTAYLSDSKQTVQNLLPHVSVFG